MEITREKFLDHMLSQALPQLRGCESFRSALTMFIDEALYWMKRQDHPEFQDRAERRLGEIQQEIRGLFHDHETKLSEAGEGGIDFLDTALTNLMIHGTEKASGDAELFYNLDWAVGFVHGADMMVPFTQIAERILKKGERLTQLKHVRFQKPVKTALRFSVQRGKGFEASNTALKGEFCTSTGETLFVIAEELPNRPIEQGGMSNPIAKMVLCECRTCFRKLPERNFAFQLSGKDVENAHELLAQSPSLRVATLVEIINRGLVKALQSYQGGKYALRLMAEVNFLDIPENFEEMLQSETPMTLTLPRKSTRVGKSGMRFYPFLCKMPGQNNEAQCYFAQTKSPRVSEKVCD